MKNQLQIGKLLGKAEAFGLKAEIIKNAKGDFRRHDSLGSTFVPQKVIMIEGIRFSIGGAKQYMDAKAKLYTVVPIDFPDEYYETGTLVIPSIKEVAGA